MGNVNIANLSELSEKDVPIAMKLSSRRALSGRFSRSATATGLVAATVAGLCIGAGAAPATAAPLVPDTKNVISDNRVIADHERVRPVASHAVLANDRRVPIVVLGARLNEDCKTPKVLDDRLNGAAELARIHRGNPVVVTGGTTQPDCPSEAKAMEKGLRLRGVSNPIVVEEKSGSTLDNVANTSDYIHSNGGVAVIVTSDPHYSRALSNYRDKGIEAVAYVEGEG